MKICTSILALLALGAFAFGGDSKFVSRPGVQEFSGELIVRPLQADALAARGIKGERARLYMKDAREELAALTTRYLGPTDELVVKVPLWSNENDFAERLMSTGRYQYAHPNWTVYPTLVPNDPRFKDQWHHIMVKSREAWDLYTGKSSWVVAVTDTGVRLDHEDLSLVSGYNSVDRKAQVDGGQVNDINGHGTHVAGCAAALGNNGKGVSGMGFNFKVMPIRVSNSPSGGASLDDILDGAHWAVENGAKTISASYSGVDAEAVGTTGTYVKSRGGLYLYAAGNDNRNLSGFIHPDTIVVGSTDRADQKSGFSAYGKGVHVFAPGSDILSTTSDGKYGFASGTSMATPVANGALAMMWSINPDLSPAEAQSLFEANCDEIGPPSIFSKGRINQFRLVNAALATMAKFYEPTSASVHTGTYVSGTVDQLRTRGFTKAYEVSSRALKGVGNVAAAWVSFKPGVTPSKVTSLRVVFDASHTATVGTTGMLYLHNFRTGKTDWVRSYSVLAGGTSDLTAQVTSKFTDYFDANGNVSAVIRLVTPSRRGSGPFRLKANFATIKVSTQP